MDNDILKRVRAFIEENFLFRADLSGPRRHATRCSRTA